MTSMFNVGLSGGLGGLQIGDHRFTDAPRRRFDPAFQGHRRGNSDGEDDFQDHGNDEDNHHDLFYLPSDLRTIS